MVTNQGAFIVVDKYQLNEVKAMAEGMVNMRNTYKVILKFKRLNNVLIFIQLPQK